MGFIITCRDGHFLDFAKKGKGFILKHRTLENRGSPDRDDLIFTKEQALELLRQMKAVLEKTIPVVKEESGNLRLNFNKKTKQLELWPSSKTWIGIGEREADILIERLEGVLR